MPRALQLVHLHQRILEATCFKHAREHLAAYLSDLEWKKRNLEFHHPEYPSDKLVYNDWQGVELNSGCKSSPAVYMLHHQTIFEALKDIWNAAIH